MKTKLDIHLWIIGIVGILVFSSCEDFLDKQEDERLTFEKIWESRNTTRQYWHNAMSFIPTEMERNVGDRDPFIGASDEGCIAFGRDHELLNFGSWNPSNIPYTGTGDAENENLAINKYYRGIRECNIFMQNVERCSDPLVTKEELAQWKVQARFARAYYYFHIMRLYGAVYLMGDEIVDYNKTLKELERPRNTWEECVEYVVSELEACIEDPMMYDTWRNDQEMGLGTTAACAAIIARLKLYAARDLFNGNKLYSGVRNPVTERFPELSGVNLFPQTYDPNKWLEAAHAAKVLIDNSSFKLYRAGNGDPYEDYYGVTNVNWNSELIWTTGYYNRHAVGVVTAPTALGHYGAVGPTQQQVDAYAMRNGIFPITGYSASGQPLINEKSGYRTREFTMEQWEYPAWAGADSYDITTPVMYKDREPRFYVNVFFSSGFWQHGDDSTKISFAKGGNSNKSHDYPKAGYLLNRFYDHTMNSVSGNWGNFTFPTFRLAEMYLNFIESVLECKKRNVTGLPASYETLAFNVWDDLRDRVGLPPIKECYPGATIDELIWLCRQERRVELSFEYHRFFDTRTWMIAEESDAGPMYGMNVMAAAVNEKETPDDYWERIVFENRIFRKNHYLFPFPQSEIERNGLLVQNYGW